MVRKCIIQTCKNTETSKRKGLIDGVTFHRFPTNEKRCSGWIRNIRILGNQMGIPVNAKICSKHFNTFQYIVKSNGTKVLSNEAKPTIFGDNIKDCLPNESLEDLDKARAKSNSDIINGVLATSEIVCKEELCIDDFDATVYTVQPNHEKEQLNKVDPLLHLVKDKSYMEIECPTDSSACKRYTCNEEEFVTNKRFEGNASAPFPVAITSRKLEPIGRVSDTSSIRRVRYAGDINVTEMNSRREMSNAILFCQKKIKDQAKQIRALKRKLKAQNNKIATSGAHSRNDLIRDKHLIIKTVSC